MDNDVKEALEIFKAMYFETSDSVASTALAVAVIHARAADRLAIELNQFNKLVEQGFFQ